MSKNKKAAIASAEDFIEYFKKLPEIDQIRAMSYVQGLMTRGAETVPSPNERM
jgi:hypothetical protein